MNAERILAGLAEMSPREREVLALMAEGLTNQEIADRLFISFHTAKNHAQHVITKLGARNRTAAVAGSIERLEGSSD